VDDASVSPGTPAGKRLLPAVAGDVGAKNAASSSSCAQPPAKKARVQQQHTTVLAAAPRALSSPSPDELARRWLPVRVMELARKAPVSGAAIALTTYVVTGQAGAGAFGVVSRAVNASSGQKVVIKTLQPDCTYDEFLHELTILSSLAHGNLVELVDVQIEGAKRSFVLTDAGVSLRAHLTTVGVFPNAVASQVLGQMASGLDYLHKHAVIHGDLKPPNVCFDVTPGRIRITDLGSAVIALPGYRSERPREEVMACGLEYGTIWYRAIEVLLGCASYAFGVDCWSLGCMLPELITGEVLCRTSSSISTIFTIISLLGSPLEADLSYCQTLPLWSQQWPKVREGQLMQRLAGRLSGENVLLVQALLVFRPAERADAAQVVRLCQEIESGSFSAGAKNANTESASAVASAAADTTAATKAPAVGTGIGSSTIAADIPAGSTLSTSSMQLVSRGDQTTFSGHRGAFNLVEGALSEDVLQWLRTSEIFTTAIPDWWSFKLPKKGKGYRSEAGLKLEVLGHLGSDGDSARPGLSLFGLDTAQPHFRRWRAWVKAFKQVNKKTFLAMQKDMRRRLQALSDSALGDNGRFLLEEDILSWVADLGPRLG